MIDSYVRSVVKASNGQLPVDQKAVLLIDCWSVHKNEEFLSWMKEEYPHLIILFVPGGTTSKFQPADTSLNRPFKATVKAAYHLWYAQDVGQQLQGHAVGEVKVGTAVGVMRDLSVGWLLSSWERLNGDASIVKKAW
jgi:cell wall assembly regulator SMI1